MPMKFKDISIRKKILLSNFLMVLIPILFVCFILFTLLLGFTTFTNSSSVLVRNVLLNSSNYGPTLLIKSIGDELSDNDHITQQAKDIFTQLEAINIHIMVADEREILYQSKGSTPDTIQEETYEIGQHELSSSPYILWNENGIAYQSIFPNKNKENLTMTFAGKGLALPTDSYTSWEHTKLIIKIAIVVTGAFMILLIVALGVFLTKKITRYILHPMKELQDATNEIRQGNLDCPLAIQSQDEFGELCGNFESMRKQLVASDALQKHYESNRKELIAGISHDLSTPLTSIQGYVNGLLDGIADTPEKQLHYLEIIQDKTKSMNMLVDSLFLMSKLDLNQEPFMEERVNLTAYLQDYVSECKGKYEEQQLLLSYESDDRTPLYICMDRSHFSRVLDNLCQNSIKYKKDDIVHMKITQQVVQTTCILHFQDDGCGIQREEATRLFDNFYRSDPARSSKIKGNGLGLSIARQIIEHMNGSIRAEGEPNKGLCIILQLPIMKEEEHHAENTNH